MAAVERELAGARVLLVEDNPVNALVAEAELQRLGVQVTVLTNGRQALDWLEHQPADLVLMDCEMPEMDGIEATGRIRARERATGKPPVRIVALTANAFAEDREVAGGIIMQPAKMAHPEGLEALLRAAIAVDGRAIGIAGHIGECMVTAMVGLADRARDKPATFSGGMKRRLNIACALLHDPQLLILDEPTVGVDPQSRNAIFDTLLALKAAGFRVLTVPGAAPGSTMYCEPGSSSCITFMAEALWPSFSPVIQSTGFFTFGISGR